MITPLKNLSYVNSKAQQNFTGSAFKDFKSYNDYTSSPIQQQNEVLDKNNNKKPSLYLRTKKAILSLFKGANNIGQVAKGTLKGAAKGLGAFYVIACAGKNLKNAFHDKKIFTFVSGVAKDIADSACFMGKNIAKAPAFLLENKNSLKGVFKLAQKGITKTASSTSAYLKNNKKLAALAAGAGLLVFAKNTLEGKVRANKANAGLDHRFNYGHIK